MANGNITKPNLGPHYGKVLNRLTFAQAFKHIDASPGTRYATAGNKTTFVAKATRATRGAHKNQEVIVFCSSEGEEKARAYRCCWGHRTNCNSTHIDCYTKAI